MRPLPTLLAALLASSTLLSAGQIPERGRVGELTRALGHGSAERREQAALELAGLGSVAAPAVPNLIAALDDEQLPVYVAAGFALARIGDAALPGMQKALRERGDTARAQLAHILGRIGPAAAPAVPALVDALNRGAAPARESVATALGQILDGAAALPAGVVEGLLKLMASDAGSPLFSHARAAAASSLGAIGPPAEAAVPGLLAALGDADPRLRTSAAWALGGGRFAPTPARWMRPRETPGGIRARPEQVVPALLAALDDPDPAVRWASAQALAGFGEAARDAIPLLRAMVGVPGPADPDAATAGRFRLHSPPGGGPLRVPARPAMVPSLFGVAFRPAPAPALAAESLPGALRVPADPGAPGVLRVPAHTPAPPADVSPAATRPDFDLHRSVVRLHAAAALWRLGDRSASAAVVEVLRDDPNAAARELAATLLAQMPSAAAVPVLSAALEDPDWQVREAAALALRALER